MRFIVLDLEWNQCPNGKAYEVAELPFEIFEIGAVMLDENREIVDTFSCYIRPSVYKELHYVARGLTHVNMSMLKNGIDFKTAAERFLDWCGTDGYMMCTWGTGDLLELQRNMKYFKVDRTLDYPLYYYDVQKLFSIDAEDGKIRRSLESAVGMLGIDKKMDFHSAKGDAYYTAEVLKRINFGAVKGFFSIDTYRIPMSKAEEIEVNFGTYVKQVSQGYASRDELLKSPDILSSVCYMCGKPARKRIRWFTTNSKMHYCLAECKEHGFLKVRFRIREDDLGRFYAVKILKLTDDAGAARIRERQQEVRRRRHERREKEKMNK